MYAGDCSGACGYGGLFKQRPDQLFGRKPRTRHDSRGPGVRSQRRGDHGSIDEVYQPLIAKIKWFWNEHWIQFGCAHRVPPGACQYYLRDQWYSTLIQRFLTRKRTNQSFCDTKEAQGYIGQSQRGVIQYRVVKTKYWNNMWNRYEMPWCSLWENLKANLSDLDTRS